MVEDVHATCSATDITANYYAFFTPNTFTQTNTPGTDIHALF